MNDKTYFIDLGSHKTKAGFAGLDEPSLKIDSFIGRNYLKNYDGEESPLLIGEKDYKNPKYHFEPILKRGFIKDYENFKIFVKKIFELEMAEDPSGLNLVFTVSLGIPLKEKFMIIEALFEDDNINSVSLPLQPICALNAYGRSTGCLLEIGDSITQCLCLYDNYDINCKTKNDLGGSDIRLYLDSLLKNNGFYFLPSINDMITEDIFENYCEILDQKQGNLISLGNNGSIQNEVEYPLPDGKDIMLGDERFKATEILFKPQLFGANSVGMH